MALINGTQFMSAYGLYNLYKANSFFRHGALAIAAISFDAFHCVPDPFNEHIHMVRPHNGQVYTAMKKCGNGCLAALSLPCPKSRFRIRIHSVAYHRYMGEYGQHHIHTICFHPRDKLRYR